MGPEGVVYRAPDRTSVPGPTALKHKWFISKRYSIDFLQGKCKKICKFLKKKYLQETKSVLKNNLDLVFKSACLGGRDYIRVLRVSTAKSLTGLTSFIQRVVGSLSVSKSPCRNKHTVSIEAYMESRQARIEGGLCTLASSHILPLYEHGVLKSFKWGWKQCWDAPSALIMLPLKGTTSNLHRFYFLVHLGSEH